MCCYFWEPRVSRGDLMTQWRQCGSIADWRNWVASIWGFCSISYRKDGNEYKMEVYFLKNASKIEVNQNAEVKMITVASRRPNPSSISDSKGGVYIRMLFFSLSLSSSSTAHLWDDTCQWLALWNNIFENIFCVCVLIWFDVHSPGCLFSVRSLCVRIVLFSLRNAMCYVYLSAISYMWLYSVLLAFSVSFCFFSQGLYTIPTYSKRSHLDAQR